MKNSKLVLFALLAILMLLTFACNEGEAGAPKFASARPISTDQEAKDLLRDHLHDIIEDSTCNDLLAQEVEESRPFWVADYIPSEQVWEIRAIGYGGWTEVLWTDLVHVNPAYLNIRGMWRVYPEFNRVGSANEAAQYFELVAWECK